MAWTCGRNKTEDDPRDPKCYPAGVKIKKWAYCRRRKRMGVYIAAPNITLYYQAALLDSLIQWRIPATKHCWMIEQLSTIQPLSEWALLLKFPEPLNSRNPHIRTFK